MTLTLRKILYALVALGLVGVVVVFAYANPEPLAVDLGVIRFESVSLALFAVCVLGLGWVFGLASAAFALLRMARERRRMQRDLRIAEAELRTLRSLPMQDAN